MASSRTKRHVSIATMLTLTFINWTDYSSFAMSQSREI
jgi:hypothetical protein